MSPIDPSRGVKNTNGVKAMYVSMIDRFERPSDAINYAFFFPHLKVKKSCLLVIFKENPEVPDFFLSLFKNVEGYVLKFLM